MMRLSMVLALLSVAIVAAGAPTQRRVAARLEIYPQLLVMNSGSSVTFTAVATGRDSSGYTPKKLKWSATGGTIDAQGKYVAGTESGHHVITVTAGALQARARVRVRKAQIRIEILPLVARIRPGGTVQFIAQAQDVHGGMITFTPIWSATGGAIDKNGRYKAGTTTGTFNVTAKDAASGVTATATIHLALSARTFVTPTTGGGSIHIIQWQVGAQVYRATAKIIVRVSGIDAKTIGLYSISRTGSETLLDSHPCADGRRITLTATFNRADTEFLELSVSNNKKQVIARTSRTVK